MARDLWHYKNSNFNCSSTSSETSQEKFDKKSNSWIGHKIKKSLMWIALAATLVTWSGCDNGGWRWKDKTVPKTEQVDPGNSNVEIVPITTEIRKNDDWTYSIYNLYGKKDKISWDYISLISTPFNWCLIWEKEIDGESKFCLVDNSWLEISDCYDYIKDIYYYRPAKPEKLSNDIRAIWPGEFSFLAMVDGKKVIIENGKEVSGHYDEIGRRPYGFLCKDWDKEYYEFFDWSVTWPVDDICEVSGDWVVWAKNNWKNEFYYGWKCILTLPLSLKNEECQTVYNSFHLVDWKICWVYQYDWWSAIILWEKIIKTKYVNVENVQINKNWTISYVWWKDNSCDWMPEVICVVSGSKVKELSREDVWYVDIEYIRGTDKSLDFYVKYGYFNED